MEIPAGVWSQYGYESTPYSTTALQIRDADERLLVGRDDVLKLILRDLASGSQMIALEGDYGVGKSSLAAVATSQAARWKSQRTSGPRFLASGTPLELVEADTADSLEKRAYYQIAGAILAESPRLICQWPIRSAHWRPIKVPARGHENCPSMANRSAHPVVGGVGQKQLLV